MPLERGRGYEVAEPRVLEHRWLPHGDVIRGRGEWRDLVPWPGVDADEAMSGEDGVDGGLARSRGLKSGDLRIKSGKDDGLQTGRNRLNESPAHQDPACGPH